MRKIFMLPRNVPSPNDTASLFPGDILECTSLHIYLNKLNKHEKMIFFNHWNKYLPIKSLRLKKKSFPQEKQNPGIRGGNGPKVPQKTKISRSRSIEMAVTPVAEPCGV